MAKEEQILDPKVAERLDKMDWKALEASVGITREAIVKNPVIASQLAYQQMTDLVFGSTQDIAGQFSLRAVPGKQEGDLWRIKAYTIENPKTIKDELYLYGGRIYSEEAKKALFEMTTWKGNDGQTIHGRANANAGRPVAIEQTNDAGQKEKKYYLVSIHQPTNRVVGIPVDAVRSMLQDKDGNSRGVSVYGAKLTNEQVEAICKGGAVKVDGCKTKAGEEFSAFVQFDAAKRQLVPVHPTWLKKAERAGVDMGVGRKEAAEKKPEAKKATKKAAEKKPEVKKTKNRMPGV